MAEQADAQVKQEEAMAKLELSLAEVTENLNALIAVVDGIIKRDSQ